MRSMIYSRLMLAKNLLSDDWVIFISIDDGETENLRKICDEAFGGISFAADLIWQKEFSRSNDATHFSTMHDHILFYYKKNILIDQNGWRIGLLPRGETKFPQVIVIQIMTLVRRGLRLFCRLNLAPVVYYVK